MGNQTWESRISISMRVGLLVGVPSFMIGLLLMLALMGLPFVNVLIAIPTGIVIGKLIIRTEKGTLQSMYTSGARASLLAGILAALAVVIPLIAIAIAAPKGATIGQEISQLADPDLVPYPWNAIPVAMMLGAMLSTVVIMSLNIVGCFLAIKWHEKRHAKESGSVVSK